MFAGGSLVVIERKITLRRLGSAGAVDRSRSEKPVDWMSTNGSVVVVPPPRLDDVVDEGDVGVGPVECVVVVVDDVEVVDGPVVCVVLVELVDVVVEPPPQAPLGDEVLLGLAGSEPQSSSRRSKMPS